MKAEAFRRVLAVSNLRGAEATAGGDGKSLHHDVAGTHARRIFAAVANAELAPDG
jgi:hypothetical protein